MTVIQDIQATSSPAAPERSAWDVIEEACALRLSGEVTLITDVHGASRVYLTNGMVYFAEHDSGGSLTARLVTSGALQLDDIDHFGRLADGAAIDREAVELGVEWITDQTLADLAGCAVRQSRTAIDRHHPSGIARWFSSQHTRDVELQSPRVQPRSAVESSRRSVESTKRSPSAAELPLGSALLWAAADAIALAPTVTDDRPMPRFERAGPAVRHPVGPSPDPILATPTAPPPVVRPVALRRLPPVPSLPRRHGPASHPGVPLATTPASPPATVPAMPTNDVASAVRRAVSEIVAATDAVRAPSAAPLPEAPRTTLVGARITGQIGTTVRTELRRLVHRLRLRRSH